MDYNVFAGLHAGAFRKIKVVAIVAAIHITQAISTDVYRLVIVVVQLHKVVGTVSTLYLVDENVEVHEITGLAIPQRIGVKVQRFVIHTTTLVAACAKDATSIIII